LIESHGFHAKRQGSGSYFLRRLAVPFEDTCKGLVHSASLPEDDSGTTPEALSAQGMAVDKGKLALKMNPTDRHHLKRAEQ
jgi:hypothetical protein